MVGERAVNEILEANEGKDKKRERTTLWWMDVESDMSNLDVNR